MCGRREGRIHLLSGAICGLSIPPRQPGFFVSFWWMQHGLWKVEELSMEAQVSIGQVSKVKKLLADRRMDQQQAWRI